MKLIIYFILIPLVVLILIFTIKLNKPNVEKDLLKNARNFISDKLTPSPTPIPLKPDTGQKGTYTIGQLKHEGPTFKQVIFDPLDIKKNETLTVNITFDKDTPPEKVSAKLQADNKSFDITFKNENGIWIGSVKVTDTVLSKYILNISATGKGKTVTAVVAPRS